MHGVRREPFKMLLVNSLYTFFTTNLNSDSQHYS